MAIKGRLINRIRTDSGMCSTSATSNDMPVTPPSMNLLESRKPFKPNPAESAPAPINSAFFNSAINFFVIPLILLLKLARDAPGEVRVGDEDNALPHPLCPGAQYFFVGWLS